MSDNLKREIDPNQPAIYQIRVKGHLGNQWADWFSSLTISLEANGDMLLTGPLADQAALYGLLKHLRDTGLTLVSINRVGADGLTTPGTNQDGDLDVEP